MNAIITIIITAFGLSAIYVDVSPAPPVTSKPVKSTHSTLEDSKNVEIQRPPKKEVALERDTPRKVDTPIIPSVKVDSPFIKQLNQVRQQNGLNPLRENQQLNAQSQAWANEMARSGYRHSGYAGEVIAYQCPDPMDALNAWLNSPPHYAIIMGQAFSIGYGEVHSGDCYYYVGMVE